MGILDMIQSMTGQAGAGEASSHVQAAGGLMEELQNMPGGVGGLIQSMQQNGMGDQVQQWGAGQTAPAEPSQVEQGLSGTGIIDNIARRTGMSPAVVKTGLAVVVPILIHHVISKGHVDAQGNATSETQPEMGGLLQSILGRLV